MTQNNNKFLLRPLIEQLYIIRQIIGNDREPGILKEYIRDPSDMSILENANERESLRNLLKKYASKSITIRNIPRII